MLGLAELPCSCVPGKERFAAMKVGGAKSQRVLPAGMVRLMDERWYWSMLEIGAAPVMLTVLVELPFEASSDGCGTGCEFSSEITSVDDS